MNPPTLRQLNNLNKSPLFLNFMILHDEIRMKSRPTDSLCQFVLWRMGPNYIFSFWIKVVDGQIFGGSLVKT